MDSPPFECFLVCHRKAVESWRKKERKQPKLRHYVENMVDESSYAGANKAVIHFLIVNYVNHHSNFLRCSPTHYFVTFWMKYDAFAIQQIRHIRQKMSKFINHVTQVKYRTW